MSTPLETQNLTDALTWASAAATVGIVIVNEAWQHWRHRGEPARRARLAHADLRETWLRNLSAQPGSEVTSVQTLRNAVMASTLTASTAVLGLMGTVTLSAASLHNTLDASSVALPALTPRLMLELMLMATLFAALACSTMAVRYFNHVGFVSSMPVGSPDRTRWTDTAIAHVRQAGLLYGWGLRALLLVVPLVASIVHPLFGPLASVGLVAVLRLLDKVPS
jgi:uncharacterized membrane protein